MTIRILFCVLIVVYGSGASRLQAQSPLDAPAKAPPVTLGSEIKRGYDDVWNADLPYGAEEMNQAAERIVQRNDQAGRNTYGYVLGAHFALWSKLDLAWEVYKEPRNKERCELVARSVWLNVRLNLAQAGLTLQQLLDSFSPETAARVAKWEEHFKRD